jgi:glycosyltransferase involved in cell wall biosynthesis
MDAAEHYLWIGARLGRDPSPDFSTSYYLQRYPDIRNAAVNPLIHFLLHGRSEKRSPLPFAKRSELMDFKPKISVIVPNYNHARFLKQRLDSILSQTHKNIEVLILDDCSRDESRELITEYQSRFPEKIKSIFNEKNSGNVFRQWRKGVEGTDGDLVWICESDDFCEPDFLHNVSQHFRDRSVNISFGRIQFVNAKGKFQAGLDQYREGAEAGIWNTPLTRPAAEWFSKGFGVNNLIANVGGCVWRRQTLPDSVWAEAETFSVVGDWFLYCHLAGGGQIAYEPSAVSYFRQHGDNTSTSAFRKREYYEEHNKLMSFIRRSWGGSDEILGKFLSKVFFQYRHFDAESVIGPLDDVLNADALYKIKRERPHILIAFLGFHLGGGEIFPINLANALWEQGHLVSMLALDMKQINAGMLGSLNSGVAVYSADWVEELGVEKFLDAAGISLIHSHMFSLEAFFFEKCKLERKIPYLVTLHGSYEVSGLSNERLSPIAERVSHWMYLADKNLIPFKGLRIPADKFQKIRNAVPDDPRPFQLSREELGIDSDAVVFTLVARGIKRKGWRAAIEAFKKLQKRVPQEKIHLLLAGEGEEADRQAKKHAGSQGITFLGYQSRILGLYRLSDCALIPTRFGGESFPLCLIEAMKTGTPVIATRIGEIEELVMGDGCEVGILLDNQRNTPKFINQLYEAMHAMLDESTRKNFSAASEAKGKKFDMKDLANEYAHTYQRLMQA